MYVPSEVDEELEGLANLGPDAEQPVQRNIATGRSGAPQAGAPFSPPAQTQPAAQAAVEIPTKTPAPASPPAAPLKAQSQKNTQKAERSITFDLVDDYVARSGEIDQTADPAPPLRAESSMSETDMHDLHHTLSSLRDALNQKKAEERQMHSELLTLISHKASKGGGGPDGSAYGSFSTDGAGNGSTSMVAMNPNASQGSRPTTFPTSNTKGGGGGSRTTHPRSINTPLAPGESAPSSGRATKSSEPHTSLRIDTTLAAEESMGTSLNNSSFGTHQQSFHNFTPSSRLGTASPNNRAGSPMNHSGSGRPRGLPMDLVRKATTRYRSRKNVPSPINVDVADVQATDGLGRVPSFLNPKGGNDNSKRNRRQSNNSEMRKTPDDGEGSDDGVFRELATPNNLPSKKSSSRTLPSVSLTNTKRGSVMADFLSDDDDNDVHDEDDTSDPENGDGSKTDMADGNSQRPRRKSELAAHRKSRVKHASTHGKKVSVFKVSYSTDHWLVSTLDLLYLIIAFFSATITMVLIHPLGDLTTENAAPPTWIVVYFAFIQLFSFVWVGSRFFVRQRRGEWEIVDKLPAIRDGYFRSWFFFDLVYTVPIEFLFVSWQWTTFYYLLCRHFLRIIRVVTLGSNDNPLMEHRQWYRLVSFFGVLFMVLAVEATIFWSLEQVQSASLLDSVYWAVVTMTSVGYGDVVSRSGAAGQVFTAISCIIGVLLIASLTAFATSFLTTKDILSEELDRKKKMMYSMLAYYEIPWEVQREVISLFPAVLDAQSEVQFKGLIEALPPFVAEKIERYLRAKMLRNVPLFADLEDETVITQLTEKLEQRFAPPYDFVIVAGDEGQEMFFLVRGVVEVLVGNIELGEEKVVATLRTGSYFGEMALISDSNIRTASIQTVVGCELMVLAKNDFDAILGNSVELQRRIQEEVRRRAKATQGATTLLSAEASARQDEDETPVPRPHKGGRSPGRSDSGTESDVSGDSGASTGEEDEGPTEQQPDVERVGGSLTGSEPVFRATFSPATTMAEDDTDRRLSLMSAYSASDGQAGHRGSIGGGTGSPAKKVVASQPPTSN